MNRVSVHAGRSQRFEGVTEGILAHEAHPQLIRTVHLSSMRSPWSTSSCRRLAKRRLLPLSSFIALDEGVLCNFVIMETTSQSPLYVPCNSMSPSTLTGVQSAIQLPMSQLRKEQAI
jgi:hypothetical protein